MTPSVIISLCSLAVQVLGSLITIVWKLSRQNSRITQNEKDIARLEDSQDSIKEIVDEINKNLQSISTKIDMLMSQGNWTVSKDGK